MVPKKDMEKLKKKQKQVKLSKVMAKLSERFTDKELKTIAESGKVRLMPGLVKVPIVNFTGKKIKFGFMTDPHYGAIHAVPEWTGHAFKVFRDEGCKFVCITGDITEGMSNRPGHVHELTHIGYDKQKNHAIEMLSEWKKPMYLIDGNHDRWYIKGNGALIVKDICDSIKNATFLGHDEGDISLNGVAMLKLWHGEDFSSYAISYRLQKLIETFTGGEKPAMLIAGHTHKQGYFFIRHVHVVSGGAACKQSKWMRSKRMENHSGFWVIEVRVNDIGISRCKVEWFPFYA